MRRRRAADGPEFVAKQLWRNAAPMSAMRVLRDAGYDSSARADFLREVIGLTVDVEEFAVDSYILADDTQSDAEEPSPGEG